MIINGIACFQQITHQAYLATGNFVVLNRKNEPFFSKLIDNIRQKVLSILSRYIPGDKEKGLAEALLIGYKMTWIKHLFNRIQIPGLSILLLSQACTLALFTG
ncbi:MAG: hypothetical protein WDO19_11050 [Bacteroidota bacterium]